MHGELQLAVSHSFGRYSSYIVAHSSCKYPIPSLIHSILAINTCLSALTYYTTTFGLSTVCLGMTMFDLAIFLHHILYCPLFRVPVEPRLSAVGRESGHGTSGGASFESNAIYTVRSRKHTCEPPTIVQTYSTAGTRLPAPRRLCICTAGAVSEPWGSDYSPFRASARALSRFSPLFSFWGPDPRPDHKTTIDSHHRLPHHSGALVRVPTGVTFVSSI